jgi:hypothetical protein
LTQPILNGVEVTHLVMLALRAYRYNPHICVAGGASFTGCGKFLTMTQT